MGKSTEGRPMGVPMDGNLVGRPYGRNLVGGPYGLKSIKTMFMRVPPIYPYTRVVIGPRNL